MVPRLTVSCHCFSRMACKSNHLIRVNCCTYPFTPLASRYNVQFSFACFTRCMNCNALISRLHPRNEWADGQRRNNTTHETNADGQRRNNTTHEMNEQMGNAETIPHMKRMQMGNAETIPHICGQCAWHLPVAAPAAAATVMYHQPYSNALWHMHCCS